MAENKLSHADFVRRIAAKTQIAQKYVREVLAATTELMRQELQAGRKVNLSNFGIFKTAVRAARTFKAPFAPGKPVKKPARIGINFKPAQDFKRDLNS